MNHRGCSADTYWLSGVQSLICKQRRWRKLNDFVSDRPTTSQPDFTGIHCLAEGVERVSTYVVSSKCSYPASTDCQVVVLQIYLPEIRVLRDVAPTAMNAAS